MNVGQSNDIRTLLHWLAGNTAVTDERAADALARLDAAAAKRLMVGHDPAEVRAAVSAIAELRGEHEQQAEAIIELSAKLVRLRAVPEVGGSRG